MRTDKLKNILRHPIVHISVTTAKRRYRKKHPACAACGAKSTFFGRNLDVHHLLPVHVRPDLACDPVNLTTLDRHCHFFIGHMMNWKQYNTNVYCTITAINHVYNLNAVKGKPDV